MLKEVLTGISDRIRISSIVKTMIVATNLIAFLSKANLSFLDFRSLSFILKKKYYLNILIFYRLNDIVPIFCDSNGLWRNLKEVLKLWESPNGVKYVPFICSCTIVSFKDFP